MFLFNLCMILLAPGLMMVFGLMFWHKAPRDINGAFGYRTTMSRKNQDTWQFAHHYFGKLYFWLGLILLPLSIVPLLRVSGADDGTAAGVVIMTQFLQMVPLIAPIIPTEIALRNVFDHDGRRKTA